MATLVHSVDALQQAAALEFVCAQDACFYGKFDWRLPAVAAFFDWLAQCPTLEVASFEYRGRLHTSAFHCCHFAPLLLRLARRRPALQLHCTDVDCDDSLWTAESDEE